MFQTLGKLEDFAKQTNMSPEQTNAMAAMIKKAVTDPEANKALVDSGILNIRDFSNPIGCWNEIWHRYYKTNRRIQ